MAESSEFSTTLDSSLWHDMLDSAVDAVVAIDARGRVLMVNPAVERMFGYRPDEVVGRNVSLLMPEPYRSEHDGYLARYLSTGERRIIGVGREVVGQRKDGSEFPMYLSVSEVRRGGERLFTGIVRDLSERERAAAEVLRVRTDLQDIIDSMPSILVAVDGAGCITAWNREAARCTGLDSAAALGRPFAEALPALAPGAERYLAAIRSRAVIRNERVMMSDHGERRCSELVVYPLSPEGPPGAVLRLDDISNRVRLEELMVRTEKMVSVGGLAAGMAHEINNPLSAVLQACQNIERRISDDLPANAQAAAKLGVTLGDVRAYLHARGVTDFLEGIRDSAARASHIVADMLAFSRRNRDDEREPVDLAALIDTVIRLAESDYDLRRRYDFRRADIGKDLDPDLGAVECNRTEIEQVLLNIVRNAAQAMAEAGMPHPHRIVLRTRRQGAMAVVEIEDNGPGMDEDTRRRVFEPFFTTKPSGIGTGLGLSVSYFIVTEQHGGSIRVRSEPGHGTCFTIELPLGQDARP